MALKIPVGPRARCPTGIFGPISDCSFPPPTTNFQLDHPSIDPDPPNATHPSTRGTPEHPELPLNPQIPQIPSKHTHANNKTTKLSLAVIFIVIEDSSR
ncbi:uncharacterized protein PGTG_06990 [Puccinia graminis f. sp. tritici CRL 75-36-700-3]|uniref:Uncharacterized protein n=1 Tax=Puccinia graminis f. sp. tritici (strain CRL 75-36-700-3 / race SCCL) TaxID=418459 RepID=E3KAZ0_PUCGT|nr:uncharacterized protein PGTG_06990 [Puccinia graminis f. sp. tritici CRL 75-36-700-3]EFP81369.2 hypothetical protein PGTG_06990 [Puccinia graminis f. sp. tritici CRL 75-36-700-3]